MIFVRLQNIGVENIAEIFRLINLPAIILYILSPWTLVERSCSRGTSDDVSAVLGSVGLMEVVSNPVVLTNDKSGAKELAGRSNM